MRLINTFFYDEPEDVSYKFSNNVVSYVINPFTKYFKCDAKKTLDGNAVNYDFKCPGKVQKQLVNDVSVDNFNKL